MAIKVLKEFEPIDWLRNQSWCCEDLYNIIVKNNKEEAFNLLITEQYPEPVDATTLNDFCRFNYDWITEMLGIDEEEDE